MKIIISVQEQVTRSLIIDTDNYSMPDDVDDKVFEIAKLINKAKQDPNSFFNEDIYSVCEEKERISVDVFKV